MKTPPRLLDLTAAMVLLVCVASSLPLVSGNPGPRVNRTLVRGAAALGAFCLDGSLPAYHLDRGFGAGSNNWLLQFEDNWRVQVKCLHSWRQTTSFGDTFEMVLADQWGNKIQASCKKTLMLRVQRELPQGKWGVIEKMTMNPAGGKFKTTRHRYKMSIADDTVVRGSDLTDNRLFLSLANYEDIHKATSKDVPYLIDVIGRVHDLGPVQTVKAQGEDRKRVEFRLIDSQGNDLQCCLWGT